MERRPAMRASNARDFLDFFGRQYPAVHAHILRTVSAETLERIERGFRADWIPVELDGPYVDAILKFMGRDALRAASSEFVSQSLVQSPMMRSLFDGVLRLFGVNVGGVLKVLPAGLRQSYHDCFDLVIERSKAGTDALVVFDDIAPEVLRFQAYPVIWEGVFLGLYDFAHAERRLEFKLQRAARRMEARFRW